jgi:uncharacterized protein YbaR (Trm112 family)
MIDEVPRTTEKQCPTCNGDIVAWVSTDGDEDTLECRRCKTVFRYAGAW